MLTSVSDMKDFVAKDLKGLKSQHKSLTVREYIELSGRENVVLR